MCNSLYLLISYPYHAPPPSLSPTLFYFLDSTFKSYSIFHSLSDLFHLVEHPPSPSIHIDANGKFPLLLWLSNIPLCVCLCVCLCVSVCVCACAHLIFIPSSVDGHLGYFRIMEIKIMLLWTLGACINIIFS